MKILVAEPLAEAGIALINAQPGWTAVLSTPKDFAHHLSDADALLVRSAKVTAAMLAKAPHLKMIGCAGAGVDNVDLDAATAAGILVMNTPGGNAVSVAEHTLALMLAMARSIPQAVASTKSGKWEGKRFVGTELRGKTLGVIGLGSIGREVVRRARAFEMRIVASDPYVNTRSVADLSTALVSLDELYAQSDYITLHVALTTETYGILNEAAFARMKKGVRIVNCARGELIDGEALRKAIMSNHVCGAALDVFQTEPPRERAFTRPRSRFRDPAHRRVDPGSAGSSGHPHRRADRPVSARRHRRERCECSRHDGRSVSPGGPFRGSRGTPGYFRGAYRHWESTPGSLGLHRKNRRAKHRADSKCWARRSPQPVAGAESQRD